MPGLLEQKGINIGNWGLPYSLGRARREGSQLGGCLEQYHRIDPPGSCHLCHRQEGGEPGTTEFKKTWWSELQVRNRMLWSLRVLALDYTV